MFQTQHPSFSFILIRFRSYAVVVEYNAHVPPNEARTVQYKADAMWDSSQYFGTGVGAIAKLGIEIGKRFSSTGSADSDNSGSSSGSHGSNIGDATDAPAVSGYSLIYCDSHGVNCFFVRNDVLGWSPRPGREQLLPVETVYRPPNYFAKGWTYAPDQQRREWVWV
jgi:hypothetical protein